MSEKQASPLILSVVPRAHRSTREVAAEIRADVEDGHGVHAETSSRR